MSERIRRPYLIESRRATWSRRIVAVVLVGFVAFGSPPTRRWPEMTDAGLAMVLALAVVSVSSRQLTRHLVRGVASKLPAPSRPVGSAANLSDCACTPRTAAVLAAAGPAIMALLAIGFALVALLVRRASHEATTAFRAVALVDAGFVAVSLLPGYPLDGGRLLRALVWYVTDDKLGATRLLSWYGQALGWLLMGGGLALLGGSLDPLFAASALLGGWVLRVEARAGYLAEKWRELTQRLPVYRVAFLRPPRIAMERLLAHAVDDVLEAAGREGQGGPALVVDSGGRVAGVIGLDEFQRAGRSTWATVTVGAAMVPRDRALVVVESAEIGTVLDQLARSATPYALVTREDGQEPIGAISRARLERQIMRLLRENSRRPGDRG